MSFFTLIYGYDIIIYDDEMIIPHLFTHHSSTIFDSCVHILLQEDILEIIMSNGSRIPRIFILTPKIVSVKLNVFLF